MTVSESEKSPRYNGIPKQVSRYENLFQASVIHLLDTDELDTSCLHGDGSNTVVKNRNAKEPIVIARKFRWFNKEIYKDRYKVERTFGWKPDTYRRLVSLSYDKLKETRLGFRHLAYSMINFRITFNTS